MLAAGSDDVAAPPARAPVSGVRTHQRDRALRLQNARKSAASEKLNDAMDVAPPAQQPQLPSPPVFNAGAFQEGLALDREDAEWRSNILCNREHAQSVDTVGRVLRHCMDMSGRHSRLVRRAVGLESDTSAVEPEGAGAGTATLEQLDLAAMNTMYTHADVVRRLDDVFVRRVDTAQNRIEALLAAHYYAQKYVADLERVLPKYTLPHERDHWYTDGDRSVSDNAPDPAPVESAPKRVLASGSGDAPRAPARRSARGRDRGDPGASAFATAFPVDTAAGSAAVATGAAAGGRPGKRLHLDRTGSGAIETFVVQITGSGVNQQWTITPGADQHWPLRFRGGEAGPSWSLQPGRDRFNYNSRIAHAVVASAVVPTTDPTQSQTGDGYMYHTMAIKPESDNAPVIAAVGLVTYARTPTDTDRRVLALYERLSLTDRGSGYWKVTVFDHSLVPDWPPAPGSPRPTWCIEYVYCAGDTTPIDLYALNAPLVYDAPATSIGTTAQRDAERGHAAAAATAAEQPRRVLQHAGDGDVRRVPLPHYVAGFDRRNDTVQRVLPQLDVWLNPAHWYTPLADISLTAQPPLPQFGPEHLLYCVVRRYCLVLVAELLRDPRLHGDAAVHALAAIESTDRAAASPSVGAVTLLVIHRMLLNQLDASSIVLARDARQLPSEEAERLNVTRDEARNRFEMLRSDAFLAEVMDAAGVPPELRDDALLDVRNGMVSTAVGAAVTRVPYCVGWLAGVACSFSSDVMRKIHRSFRLTEEHRARQRAARGRAAQARTTRTPVPGAQMYDVGPYTMTPDMTPVTPVPGAAEVFDLTRCAETMVALGRNEFRHPTTQKPVSVAEVATCTLMLTRPNDLQSIEYPIQVVDADGMVEAKSVPLWRWVVHQLEISPAATYEWSQSRIGSSMSSTATTVAQEAGRLDFTRPAVFMDMLKRLDPTQSPPATLSIRRPGDLTEELVLNGNWLQLDQYGVPALFYVLDRLPNPVRFPLVSLLLNGGTRQLPDQRAFQWTQVPVLPSEMREALQGASSTDPPATAGTPRTNQPPPNPHPLFTVEQGQGSSRTASIVMQVQRVMAQTIQIFLDRAAVIVRASDHRAVTDLLGQQARVADAAREFVRAAQVNTSGEPSDAVTQADLRGLVAQRVMAEVLQLDPNPSLTREEQLRRMLEIEVSLPTMPTGAAILTELARSYGYERNNATLRAYLERHGVNQTQLDGMTIDQLWDEAVSRNPEAAAFAVEYAGDHVTTDDAGRVIPAHRLAHLHQTQYAETLREATASITSVLPRVIDADDPASVADAEVMHAIDMLAVQDPAVNDEVFEDRARRARLILEAVSEACRNADSALQEIVQRMYASGEITARNTDPATRARDLALDVCSKVRAYVEDKRHKPALTDALHHTDIAQPTTEAAGGTVHVVPTDTERVDNAIEQLQLATQGGTITNTLAQTPGQESQARADAAVLAEVALARMLKEPALYPNMRARVGIANDLLKRLEQSTASGWMARSTQWLWRRRQTSTDRSVIETNPVAAMAAAFATGLADGTSKYWVGAAFADAMARLGRGAWTAIDPVRVLGSVGEFMAWATTRWARTDAVRTMALPSGSDRTETRRAMWFWRASKAVGGLGVLATMANTLYSVTMLNEWRAALSMLSTASALGGAALRQSGALWRAVGDVPAAVVGVFPAELAAIVRDSATWSEAGTAMAAYAQPLVEQLAEDVSHLTLGQTAKYALMLGMVALTPPVLRALYPAVRLLWNTGLSITHVAWTAVSAPVRWLWQWRSSNAASVARRRARGAATTAAPPASWLDTVKHYLGLPLRVTLVSASWVQYFVLSPVATAFRAAVLLFGVQGGRLRVTPDGGATLYGAAVGELTWDATAAAVGELMLARWRGTAGVVEVPPATRDEIDDPERHAYAALWTAAATHSIALNAWHQRAGGDAESQSWVRALITALAAADWLSAVVTPASTGFMLYITGRAAWNVCAAAWSSGKMVEKVQQYLDAGFVDRAGVYRERTSMDWAAHVGELGMFDPSKVASALDSRVLYGKRAIEYQRAVVTELAVHRLQAQRTGTVTYVGGTVGRALHGLRGREPERVLNRRIVRLLRRMASYSKADYETEMARYASVLSTSWRQGLDVATDTAMGCGLFVAPMGRLRVGGTHDLAFVAIQDRFAADVHRTLYAMLVWQLQGARATPLGVVVSGSTPIDRGEWMWRPRDDTAGTPQSIWTAERMDLPQAVLQRLEVEAARSGDPLTVGDMTWWQELEEDAVPLLVRHGARGRDGSLIVTSVLVSATVRDGTVTALETLPSKHDDDERTSYGSIVMPEYVAKRGIDNPIVLPPPLGVAWLRRVVPRDEVTGLEAHVHVLGALDTHVAPPTDRNAATQWLRAIAGGEAQLRAVLARCHRLHWMCELWRAISEGNDPIEIAKVRSSLRAALHRLYGVAANQLNDLLDGSG